MFVAMRKFIPAVLRIARNANFELTARSGHLEGRLSIEDDAIDHLGAVSLHFARQREARHSGRDALWNPCQRTGQVVEI
jgi:hypothetical protein